MLVEHAPAKVNLTLRVLGRRADGYHNIDSLVAFAQVCDRLTLEPGGTLHLELHGPHGGAVGGVSENLVVKAAQALARDVPGLTVGRFRLDKRLPVAAGLGGGSADAAAALRLLARANDLALDDARLFAAARATGADVPVCLAMRPRVMRGIGEVLGEPLDLPELAAVLVNPGVALATCDVFAQLGLKPRDRRGADAADDIPAAPVAFMSFLADGRNELEPAAIALAPVIADVLARLRALPDCRLARMSGSGATCFALFESERDATAASHRLQETEPTWWICSTVLGSAHPTLAAERPAP